MIYTLIWAHFVCDFILQTDAMAKGKSTSNRWLTKHVAIYTFALIVPFTLCGPSPYNAMIYCLVNGLAHFGTDYVTSRVTSRLWEQQRVHDFFIVIGLDQAIHLTTLVATLPLLRLQ